MTASTFNDYPVNANASYSYICYLEMSVITFFHAEKDLCSFSIQLKFPYWQNFRLILEISMRNRASGLNEDFIRNLIWQHHQQQQHKNNINHQQQNIKQFTSGVWNYTQEKICAIIMNTLFYWTPPDDCFWKRARYY